LGVKVLRVLTVLTVLKGGRVASYYVSLTGSTLTPALPSRERE
jgi:hypothetical protein